MMAPKKKRAQPDRAAAAAQAHSEELQSLQGQVAALERQNEALTRRETLLNKAVQIRDLQAQMLTLHAKSGPGDSFAAHLTPEAVHSHAEIDVAEDEERVPLIATSNAGAACSASAALPGASRTQTSPTPLMTTSRQASQPGAERSSGQALHAALVDDNSFLSHACAAIPAAMRGKELWAETFDLPALSMPKDQHLTIYARFAMKFGELLVQAEDSSSPSVAKVRARLAQAMQVTLSRTFVLRVCNPHTLDLMGSPVNTGLPPATDAHWERVAVALQLSVSQVEDVQQLDELQLQWMPKAKQEELSAVGSLLDEVLMDVQRSKWRFELPEAEVRKAELMAQVPKAASTCRWIVALVEEILLSHILTLIQAARYIVHTYPYFPSGCDVVRVASHMAQHAKHRGLGSAAGAGALSGVGSGPGVGGPVGSRKTHPAHPKGVLSSCAF